MNAPATRVERDAAKGRRLTFALRLDHPEGTAARLPGWTRASLFGEPGAPLLIVLGGISADSNVVFARDGRPGWWHGLFGPGAPLGIDRFRVLGIDFIADETGSYAPDTYEQADILAEAIAALGEKPAAIIGSSYGGMVALAFAERHGSAIPLVIVSASASPHPMATAARSLQRELVRLGMERGCAAEALAIARGMAMLTYRTPGEFGTRFARGIEGSDPCSASEPLAYLKARGEAYLDVMPPGRFLSLSASIDRHLVAPAKIKAPALVIAVEEDRLVPLEDIAALARELGGPVEFRPISSPYGHDAFLKEPELLGRLIAGFLKDGPKTTGDILDGAGA